MNFFNKTIAIGLFLVFFLDFHIHAQKNHFVKFDNHPELSQKDLMKALEIDPSNTIVLIDTDQDEYGIHHDKYQQQIAGIDVEGAVFIKHLYTDGTQLVNGLWLKDFQIKSPKINLTEEQAIARLKFAFNSNRKFAWDIKVNNPSFLPEVQLVWYDKSYGTDPSKYNLCYKLDIFVSNPFESYTVFVDAQNGAIINKYVSMHTVNHPGHGEGFYTNGEVMFTVDSLQANAFEMVKHYEDGSISFSTFNELTNSVISSNNNSWTDQAAVDCHWGTEKTLDYFLEHHDHKGLDNEGGEVLVNVHAQDPLFGGPMANAYYIGGTINIGDGNADTPITVPLSSLDIVAHELVHGVKFCKLDLRR